MRKLNFFDYVCNFFIKIRKLNKIYETYHSSQVPQLVLKGNKIILLYLLNFELKANKQIII